MLSIQLSPINTPESQAQSGAFSRGILQVAKEDTPVKLSVLKIDAAKPREKQYKLADGKGLFLIITPKGSKYWRFRYHFYKKEKSLAIGIYPEIGLKEARQKRDDALKLLANDIDPSLDKKLKKKAKSIAAANSFEAVAREWYAKFSSKWVNSHGERILRRLEKDIFPWMGKRPIAEINAPELLDVLHRIEKRGANETAHRALQNCGQIFRYAIVAGNAERDPSRDLRGALTPVKKRHHATIVDPKAIGELLRVLNGYQGNFETQCALRLAPLLFVRPGELRKAEWSEIDLENAVWRIPATKMKMRELHIVPLATQAIGILQELHPLTGGGKYVFSRTSRPMSDNTLTAALRKLDYSKEQMTIHGFRSMACTLLNELGYKPDFIERQLAHAERNNVRAAYNNAQHLEDRRKMMQDWADYLDNLTQSNNRFSIKKLRSQ